MSDLDDRSDSTPKPKSRQPYLRPGVLRVLGVGLAVVFYLNVLVQGVGLLFSDLAPVRAWSSIGTSLIFGTAFLALVLNSRRVDEATASARKGEADRTR